VNVLRAGTRRRASLGTLPCHSMMCPWPQLLLAQCLFLSFPDLAHLLYLATLSDEEHVSHLTFVQQIQWTGSRLYTRAATATKSPTETTNKLVHNFQARITGLPSTTNSRRKSPYISPPIYLTKPLSKETSPLASTRRPKTVS
jgi:hypothetical protein